VLQFRENAKWGGMNGTPGAIPVTTGASIDRKGMVVKNEISENGGNHIMNGEGPEMDHSSPNKQRGMSISSLKDTSDGGKNGSDATDPVSDVELTEHSESSMGMCSGCGMSKEGGSCTIS